MVKKKKKKVACCLKCGVFGCKIYSLLQMSTKNTIISLIVIEMNLHHHNAKHTLYSYCQGQGTLQLLSSALLTLLVISKSFLLDGFKMLPLDPNKHQQSKDGILTFYIAKTVAMCNQTPNHPTRTIVDRLSNYQKK